MIFNSVSAIPLQSITHFYPFLSERKISLQIFRTDLIHPAYGGNKWFKLKYNILDAINKKNTSILTFGGAYSNHLVATAECCRAMGLKAIGFVRGEKPKTYGATLRRIEELGMVLNFISRSEYRRKDDIEFLKETQREFPNSYIIPEGGTNSKAIRGTKEITEQFPDETTHIVCAVGTGGTMAGIIESNKNKVIIGYAALKGTAVSQMVSDLIDGNHNNFKVFDDRYFGGYAKMNQELIDFIMAFYKQTSIPLDGVYTGKMMYRLFQDIQNNEFLNDVKIVAIHSGGLQGNEGLNHLYRCNLPVK